MGNELDDYIEELQDTVVVAELNYHIWWVYRGEGTREKYLDTMNDYVAFFSTSIHAHFVAMLTALYRLYETRRDTRNIPQLLRLLKGEGLLDQSELSELKDCCSLEVKPLWVKVSDLRNKAFSHRSNLLSVQDVFRAVAVKPDDFKQLIGFSKKLLNKITQKRSKSTHAFNLTSRDHAIGILEVLKEIRSQRLQADLVPGSGGTG